MSNFLEVDRYKQQVAAYFDSRINYDRGDFHPQIAHLLLEYTQITKGKKVLDIATGTGLVAIEAAQLVGCQGSVIGVDISPGMLNQGRSKIAQLGLKNIELIEADAEALIFPKNSFDLVLCCSALPYFTNIPNALCHWYSLLKSGGKIGLCVFSETSFIPGIVLQKVAKKYGLELPNWNEITGNEQKCKALLAAAGFQDIEVITKQVGNYLAWENLATSWSKILKNPLYFQFLKLDDRQLEKLKQDYFSELKALSTNQGIWNDITTFLVFGRK
ncbi:MAG: methyltransferase domain-containing protein [Oscillatoria sp. PMC 1051.18]|nr:methyltransferase domain-containing protein [Oscillatoria sp. PMC 1050.18]MEC5028694.1 methyltransferase domain-containing protein [Oscillatoria sp. PMC 1051.18]